MSDTENYLPESRDRVQRHLKGESDGPVAKTPRMYWSRGREEIYTDYKTINSGNIIEVLEDALVKHSVIAQTCRYLDDYERGNQPLQREKTYRPGINVVDIDNVANQIAEFWQNYVWGCPMLFVQRGSDDKNQKQNSDEIEAITLLNEEYHLANGLYTGSKTAMLARNVEVEGIGFTYVDVNVDYEEGDSHFTLDVLDPEYTFIVKHSGLGHKPVLGVTFSVDTQGLRHITAFTSKNRYELNEYFDKDNNRNLSETNRSGEINPLGIIPIIEYIRSYDRMGVFERQIPEMDALNLMNSDFANDVDQNTQAVWHANDIEPAKDDNGNVITPKDGQWLYTYTAHDGRTPMLNPLSVTYDYPGMLSNIQNKRVTILQKCNVPQRNDTTGGSTGIAMADASGWTAAETAATKETEILYGCKLQELRVVLKAIEQCLTLKTIEVSNPMLKLKASDVRPNVNRQKSYEMVTKANAYATWVNHGISPMHALEQVNAFPDVNQVITDSKEYLDKFYEKNFADNNAEANTRLMGDYTDQIVNSPSLDGINKQEENEKPIK